jgi:quinol monooxygenase YgiN
MLQPDGDSDAATGLRLFNLTLTIDKGANVIRSTLTLLLVSLLSAATAQAFECSADEVGYFATFKVQPGREAEFEEQVLTLTDKVRELEPGAVFYAPYRGSEAGVYHFMERYQDEPARSAHAQADEIRAVFGKIIPLLREPLDVVRVSALCP